MQTLEYRTVDKSDWGDGPWQSEPDKKQWTDPTTGYPCLIVRGPRGALCGYVGLSEDHPLFGLGYNDEASLPKPILRRALANCTYGDLYLDKVATGEVEIYNFVDIHGGLTFASLCNPRATEAEGICHLPGPNEPDHVWWFGFDCNHHNDMSPMRDPVWSRMLNRHGIYRDLAYVEGQIACLAEQFRALEHYSNGMPKWAEDGTLLNDLGNRSIFDDVGR